MTLVLTPLLATMGPAALLLVIAVIFAETGLLVGFFLPGDSLLFAAGLFVAAGAIPLPVALVIAAAWAAAVAGDQVAFTIGRRLGPRLFARKSSRLWSAKHVAAARVFFDRHGHKAVILARFVPLARTFTPVVAGAVGMPRRRFSTYNVVGGLAWTTSMTLAGFFLGGVPIVAAHVELVTISLVALSLVPAGVTVVRSRRRRKRADHTATSPEAAGDHRSGSDELRVTPARDR